VEFHGTVITTGGLPVSDSQINVISPTFGTGITYTNAEGTFTCIVPKNQSLTLNVNLTCNTTNDWAIAHTETIISEEYPIVGLYTAELSNYYPITGTVVNCSGQPVESGYVKMGLQIFIAENGAFIIQTCGINEYVIQAYDTTTPDSTIVGESDTVQVVVDGINIGSIEACFQFFGIVTDIDGNIYTTVTIGNQKWMAENLKTEKFSDGSGIPNVTVNTNWQQLITPGWCYFNNSIGNNAIYGKLYNWFTVVDSRNVCPLGWHVPNDSEWIILTDYLGGEVEAGGKMKTTNIWGEPNTGATNQSGFSAKPGGSRFYSGTFYLIEYRGHWWSASEESPNTAWSRSLNYNNETITRNIYSKQEGFSIRCLKD
jgi:uncharacterized protein (TIGR02145 family)